MKRKILSILFAMVLVVSLSLVMAVPAAASDLEVGAGKTYTTIQAAIDAANPGDTILVYAGTYAENLVIDKAITLKSVDGEAATTIDASATAVGGQRGAIQIAATVCDVTIGGAGTGFTIIAPNTGNQYGVEIGLNCDRATIQDNTISGDVQVGVHIWGAGDDAHEDIVVQDNTITTTETAPAGECYGIVTAPIDQALNLFGAACLIDGNNISGFSGCGMYLDGLDGTSDIVISDNTLYDNTRHGLVVVGREVSVTGNTIYGNTLNGLTIAGAIATTNITVEDNSIYSNTEWGIRIYWGTATAITVNHNGIYSNTGGGLTNGGTGTCPAEDNWWGTANGPAHAGNTFNVGAQGNAVSDNVDYVPWYDTDKTGTTFAPVNNTTAVTKFSSIQAAINAASASDTIACAAGTYTEDVTVGTANLTLESTAGKATTFIEGEIKVENAGDNFTLGGTTGKGFTLNSDTGNAYLVWVDTTADDVTISWNTLNTAGDVADAVRTYTAHGLTVTQNTFAVTDLYDQGVRGHIVAGDGDGWITELTVSNNTFTCPSNTLETSAVELCELDINSQASVISENTFTSMGNGIVIGSDSATAGLVGGSSTLTISSNTFTGCKYGIDLVNATSSAVAQNIVISQNTFTSNTEGLAINHGAYPNGADLWQPEDFVVKYNDFSGNTYGIYNAADDTDPVLTAEYNYWGKATGAYHVTTNPGVAGYRGDAVTDYVDYAPWLYLTTAANDGDTLANIITNTVPAYANAVVLSAGWNTFSAPIGLDGQYNTWAELYTLTGLDYSLAYRFDPTTQTFVSLGTTTTYAIAPGEGFYIKMTSADSIPYCYSTVFSIPSRALGDGWDMIGGGMTTRTEIASCTSIATAGSTAGYSHIVNPAENATGPQVYISGNSVFDFVAGEGYWAFLPIDRTLGLFDPTPVAWVALP